MKKAFLFVLALLVSVQIFAGIHHLDIALESIVDEYNSKTEMMQKNGLGNVEGKIVAILSKNIELEIENVKSLLNEYEIEQTVDAQSRVLKALENLENLVKEL